MKKHRPHPGQWRHLRAKARKPNRPFKSVWEEQYAAHLTLLFHAREISGWRYEAFKLRLADGTWHAFDFFVTLPNGTMEVHEVKGQRREAGMLRFKIGAEMWPEFRWLLIRKERGTWTTEEYGVKNGKR